MCINVCIYNLVLLFKYIFCKSITRIFSFFKKKNKKKCSQQIFITKNLINYYTVFDFRDNIIDFNFFICASDCICKYDALS